MSRCSTQSTSYHSTPFSSATIRADLALLTSFFAPLVGKATGISFCSRRGKRKLVKINVMLGIQRMDTPSSIVNFAIRVAIHVKIILWLEILSGAQNALLASTSSTPTPNNVAQVVPLVHLLMKSTDVSRVTAPVEPVKEKQGTVHLVTLIARTLCSMKPLAIGSVQVHLEIKVVSACPANPLARNVALVEAVAPSAMAQTAWSSSSVPLV